MEQSLAADQTATRIFHLPSSTGAFTIRSVHPHPSLPSGVHQVVASSLPVPGFPLIPFSPTMSQAALGTPPTLRFNANTSLSPDPPAAGPSVASMPATNRLRAAVLARGAAAATAAAPPTPARRTARSSRRAPADAPSEEPPRRSQRARKRAPAADEEPRDPPTKKPKRANLKSAPPASAKSDKAVPVTQEDSEQQTASCCICMDEPKPADLASINGCDHLFCFDCIEKWGERENTCPLCKVRFSKIDRVNKTKKKKGETAKNTKKVKQKDQRSDIAPGAALEGLLASFASSANFPPSRVARLIFSGMGAGTNPFAAVLPGGATLRGNRAPGAAAAERAHAMEDSLFSSDTDDDEDQSFLPGGGAAGFADLFRAMPLSNRNPGILVGGPLGHRGISMTSFDPPTGRSYASNSSDRNAGRHEGNPLEIEDDSEDEEDIEVVQVTRPV